MNPSEITILRRGTLHLNLCLNPFFLEDAQEGGMSVGLGFPSEGVKCSSLSLTKPGPCSQSDSAPIELFRRLCNKHLYIRL